MATGPHSVSGDKACLAVHVMKGHWILHVVRAYIVVHVVKGHWILHVLQAHIVVHVL